LLQLNNPLPQIEHNEELLHEDPDQPLQLENHQIEHLLPADLMQEVDIHPQDNLNLQVGFMRHQNSRMIYHVFESFTMPIGTSHPPADLFRLWGKYFSPLGDPKAQVSISINWAPFFSLHLLKKESFQWAKKILHSEACEFILLEGPGADSQPPLQFSLPYECLEVDVNLCESSIVNAASLDEPSVYLDEPSTPEHMAIFEQSSLSTRVLFPKKRKQRQINLVDTELRRSLRIKAHNTGFKASGCEKKNCLGCDIDPPHLSSRVIRNLGSNFCKMDLAQLFDATLSTSKVKDKVVGNKSNKAARKAPLPSRRPPKEATRSISNGRNTKADN
jgi:hypothetical protein